MFVRGDVRQLGRSSWMEGGSREATAWTVGLGFAIGMFPLMGITTIVCAAIAALFRLRQAPIQLGNYAALPLQIILLIPFLRLGEQLTHAERFVFDVHALMKGFPNVPESTARAVVMAQWHMILGWALVAPVGFVVAYAVTKMVLKRLSPQRTQRIAEGSVVKEIRSEERRRA